MLAPPPKRPTGGTAVLFVILLGIVIGALLIWAWVRANPARPHPAGTANPKVLPATSTGGARPLH